LSIIVYVAFMGRGKSIGDRHVQLNFDCKQISPAIG